MKFLKTDNMIGAAFMCSSMAAFAFNDATVKYVAANMDVYQAVFIRGLFTIVFIGIVACASGTFRHIPDKADQKRIAWRTVTEVGATLAFITALVHMPLANITAMLQALPLTVSIAAAIFFREYFGWHRSIAILVGFIGMLIIIRPGADGFNAYALLGLIAVLFVTWRDLISRRFAKNVSSLLVSFITATAITLVSGLITFLFGEWTPVTPLQLAYLALAAGFIFAGYYSAIAAMRVGEVAAVTPFRYTVMIWAILLGWLIWGDIPDGWTLLGMVIVIGMGAYTLWREHKV
ncbi:MAG: DMT family transporter [Rhodobacterales bacterium]